jgi:hypothetical protein
MQDLPEGVAATVNAISRELRKIAEKVEAARTF